MRLAFSRNRNQRKSEDGEIDCKHGLLYNRPTVVTSMKSEVLVQDASTKPTMREALRPYTKSNKMQKMSMMSTCLTDKKSIQLID